MDPALINLVTTVQVPIFSHKDEEVRRTSPMKAEAELLAMEAMLLLMKERFV